MLDPVGVPVCVPVCVCLIQWAYQCVCACTSVCTSVCLCLAAVYTHCRLPLQCLCVCWSGLKLPWLELDWFMDLSSRITKLDLSSNCLAALPSVVPWGLIQLHTLDLSNNSLKDLPSALSSQEIICSKYAHTHRNGCQLTRV